MNTLDLNRLGELARPLRPWLNRLPALAAAVVVVGLAHTLAQATWRLFPPPEEAPPPAVAPSPPTAATTKTTDWGARLARSHLFGQAPVAAPKAETSVPIEAPETQLRLTLRGIYLAGRGGDSGFAIIADAGGKDETYAIGDPLPGGAVLKEIYPDRVILERQGRLETLRLPRDQGGARSVTSVSAGARSRGGGTLTVPPDAGRVLARYRERLLSDPQSVMDVVRAEPYRRGGRIVGYRVFPGRDRGLLAQVGLQPGDVITEVNGLGLDNPLNGLEIMRDLQNARQITVKVLRNGVERQVSIDLP